MIQPGLKNNPSSCKKALIGQEQRKEKNYGILPMDLFHDVTPSKFLVSLQRDNNNSYIALETQIKQT